MTTFTTGERFADWLRTDDGQAAFDLMTSAALDLWESGMPFVDLPMLDARMKRIGDTAIEIEPAFFPMLARNVASSSTLVPEEFIRFEGTTAPAADPTPTAQDRYAQNRYAKHRYSLPIDPSA